MYNSVTVQSYPHILFRSCGQLWLQNKTWTEWPGNKASYTCKNQIITAWDKHTCSSLQQGLCVQLCDQPSTPFPWQFADTCRGELTEHGKSVVYVINYTTLHHFLRSSLEYSVSYTPVMQKSQILLCTKLTPE